MYKSLAMGEISLTSALPWSTHWRCVNGIGGGGELAVIQLTTFTRALESNNSAYTLLGLYSKIAASMRECKRKPHPLQGVYIIIVLLL